MSPVFQDGVLFQDVTGAKFPGSVRRPSTDTARPTERTSSNMLHFRALALIPFIHSYMIISSRHTMKKSPSFLLDFCLLAFENMQVQ